MFKAVIVLVLASACTVANVEVDVSDIRITSNAVDIHGLPGVGAAKHTLVFDELESVQTLVDHGAEISFVGAELRATDGIDSLAFVEQTTVTLGSGNPKSNLMPITAYDCDHNCTTRGRSLVMAPAHKQPATEYIKSGAIAFDLELVGAMPGQQWTMEIEVLLEAQLDKTVDLSR